MENMQAKLEAFAAKVESDCIDYLHRAKLDCEANINNVRTRIVPGKKYTKVDIGTSGRFMIVNETGEIFGIKAYGVIHKGHFFGTLDDFQDKYWGRY
jgi:hypothetical protein